MLFSPLGLQMFDPYVTKILKEIKRGKIGSARLSSQCEKILARPGLARSYISQSGSARLAVCKAPYSLRIFVTRPNNADTH